MRKESYPQGSHCLSAVWLMNLQPSWAAGCWSAMSNHNAAIADAVVPFAPKLNRRSETSDTLDRAGQAILGLLNRAASAAEANCQQAVEMANKLSGQVRAAEGRIRELEAQVRHHQDRADRAEKWLYQISVEIEQNFFGRGDSRPLQPSPPQAVSGQKR
jgi:hypothetical protein